MLLVDTMADWASHWIIYSTSLLNTLSEVGSSEINLLHYINFSKFLEKNYF